MGFRLGRQRGRALTQIATAALTTTLLGAAGGTAVADSPAPVPAPLQNVPPQTLGLTVPWAAKGKAADAPESRMAAPALSTPGAVSAPSFHFSGVAHNGDLYQQLPNRSGFEPRTRVAPGWGIFKAAQNVDRDKDGFADGLYTWDTEGNLRFTAPKNEFETETSLVGGGWNIYDKVLSPGDLGGGTEPDIMAVDKAGVMHVYLAYSDGRLTGRATIGGGWDQYTQIAGQGDVTGDGKADIVARDTSGILWLYKGTGNWRAPFEPREKIGGGWNMYDRLLSTGDVDGDGNADLLARTPSGDLMLYKGNGRAAGVHDKPVKIGWNYDTYRLMF
ncbi:FG-GAP repeat domain-containing protein [Streptomyces noursei]|uniref:FG-GAP repeat domain-containing protein n=1 Tax=Streptomyces noursei TaxID=1971 RepID=UPI0019636801|nr:VCBS repeat-containing protein [Streptomyces noursei]QRX91954.1 VCBS repeat-containing protein [Streptomyces noursei]